MNYPIHFHQSPSVPISLSFATIFFGAFAWFIIIFQLMRKHPDVDALFYGTAWLIPFLIFLCDLLFGCWISVEITHSSITIKYILSKTVIQRTQVKNLAPEKLKIYDKGSDEAELSICLENGQKISLAKVHEGPQRLYAVLQEWLYSA